jgi:hypothetical protein
MKKQGLILAVFILIFLYGCVNPQPPAPQPPAPHPQTQNTTPQNLTVPCSDKDCFITAANDCQSMNLTVSEDFGVMEYSSSTGCVFTKTLVSLNENETQEMKNLLKGKSMTCAYEKGKFDSRLVTSLIYGMENCQGELKDDLGRLIVFS